MAALSDADLRIILGSDYQAAIQSIDEEKSEDRKKLDAKNQMESRLRACESSRLSAFFLLSGGLVFIWADWMLNGYSITIQLILGIVSFVVGAIWFVYILGVMRKLNPSDGGEPALESNLA